MAASNFIYTTGSTYNSDQSVAYHNAAFTNYSVPFTLTVPRYETMMGGVYNHIPYLSIYMHTATGDFVGFARTATRGTRAWCGGLAIVPSWRGKKIGPLLVQKYLDLLREKSEVKVLQLECIIANVAALKLYRSAGFETNYELWNYTVDIDVDDNNDNLNRMGQGGQAGQEMNKTGRKVVREADRVDLKLPWLQYRVEYSWQREMSCVLALKAVQYELRTGGEGEKGMVVVVVAEARDDHVRIVAMAYDGELEPEDLAFLVRYAAKAQKKNRAEIDLEPNHSPAIPLLEKIAKRDRSLEEEHMVYHFDRS